ncbi:hypothetical protein B1813_03010 [Saccharomonospora piscinae]|uniref:Uncharacterized protein n=1 Tax=Saccharomonospora piscinae TaxID=687388 RepID=A0A1V9AD92_SACPI|nr:hypothetical protein [Saccharomonospora piscinae]OQO95043.1 hypothetical protein B1813_03010 [Saccharomonospora piscinae]TLW90435.1 hypothetical protein FFT09_21220 [Saccharomonospora piscinae]
MTNSSGASRAKAFDVRLVIALLIGVYGAVLTVLGIGFTSEDDLAKSADININLWTGLAMLVFATAFVLWARLRPVVVPPEEAERLEQDKHD